MTPWIVAGSGNPGRPFPRHRHNVGFLVVDELAARQSLRFSAPRGLRAEIADARFGPPGPDGVRATLAKSRTYMNETGNAVSGILNYYRLGPDRLIAVHDELDLDPGQLRV